MKRSIENRAIFRTVATGLLLVLLQALNTGCSVGYIVGQGWGQMKVLAGREHIGRLLNDPKLDEETRSKLEMVLAAREFAIEQIGANPDSENYLWYYDHGQEPIIYAVTASKKDAFEPYLWRFPILGAVPYKGHFDETAAEREGARLRALDYDVTVGGRRAYSTLGWFPDPIFSGMMVFDEPLLVDVILHELTHTAIYVPNATDFNETLANFVGEKGTLKFYSDRGASAEFLQRLKDWYADRRTFMHHISRLYRELGELYRNSVLTRDDKLERRKAIFKHYQQTFSALPMKTGAYGWFPDDPLNNATIQSYTRYNGDLEVFERAWQAHDGDFKAFLDEMDNLGEDPSESLRNRYPG